MRGINNGRRKIFEKRWELASVEQRARYHNLMSSYRNIDWTYKEKKYLLWLCQLDVNTFETFEVILDKIKTAMKKELIYNGSLFLFY